MFVIRAFLSMKWEVETKDYLRSSWASEPGACKTVQVKGPTSRRTSPLGLPTSTFVCVLSHNYTKISL